MENSPTNSFAAVQKTLENRFSDAPNVNFNAFDPEKYIVRGGDVKKNIIKTFHEGKPKGLTTHIPQLDPVFKWKPGYLYCFTGWPQHGKSEKIKFLALMAAVKAGWKSSFYSPESHPAEEFYESIARSYVGKSTIRYHHNVMSERELSNALDFVHENFFYIGDEHSRPMTPEQIRIVNECIHAKTPLHLTVKDPWNKLKHERRGRSIDDYLSDVLPEEQAFARKNGICNIILAHPKTGDKLKRGEEQPLPGPDWLHGGQMWDNMCDVIATVHRPNFHISRSSEEVLFAVFKFKNQQVVDVRPGHVENIKFAFFESRYYFDGVCPLFDVGVQKNYTPDPEIPFQMPASEFDFEAPVVLEEDELPF